MKPAFLMGWLGTALLAACTGLGATDTGSSPDASSQPGTSVGSVGTTCTAEINLCGWTALECSSDPECAHWYACVLDCHPTNGLQGCFDACSNGQSPSSSASALQKCLLSAHNGACSPPEADAGADGTIVEPAKDSGIDAPTYTSCDTCLWGNCEAQITSCTTPEQTPPDCMDYKHLLLTCAKADSQLGFEKCLLQADIEVGAAHKDFAASGSLACIVYNCAELCLPPDARSCAACSRTQCPEAWDAYLRSSAAQNLAWCRHNCLADAACISGCKDSYGDGAGVLSALVACQSQSCSDCD